MTVGKGARSLDASGSSAIAVSSSVFLGRATVVKQILYSCCSKTTYKYPDTCRMIDH